MENTHERYSDADLEEFRVLIQSKIDKAEEDLRILREQFTNDMDNGTEDTSPIFKSFEEGSETMSKEANAQLAARQEKFLRDLRASSSPTTWTMAPRTPRPSSKVLRKVRRP